AFDPVAGTDTAVDGIGIPEAGAVADADAAVDRAQVAGLLVRGQFDAAVDAADVLCGQRGGSGQQKGEEEGMTEHDGILCGRVDGNRMPARRYNRICHYSQGRMTCPQLQQARNPWSC